MSNKQNPQNSVYRAGAIWCTRAKLRVFEDANEMNIVHIPRWENIFIVGYYMDSGKREHIHLLWEEKLYFAYDIDPALDFYLEPERLP